MRALGQVLLLLRGEERIFHTRWDFDTLVEADILEGEDIVLSDADVANFYELYVAVTE